MLHSRSVAALCLLALVGGSGCSASEPRSVGSPGDSGDAGSDGSESSDEDDSVPPDDEDEDSDAEDSDEDDEQDDDDAGPPKPPPMVFETLPAGFTAGTIVAGPDGPLPAGGWKVLGPLEDFDQPADNACVNVLRAVIRDFTQAHIDFGEEKPVPWTAPGLYTGQILDELSDSRKPEINPARTPKDVIEKLEDWYVNVEGVNVPYVMDFWLEPDAERPGSFVFDVVDFFPLDKFNMSPGDVQNGRNFLFTIEIHTSFEYRAGQVFSFRGDDDVFVFVNGHLAVDLGGIHGPVPGSVDLDAKAKEFGLVEGQVYNLDLFQAERNPGGSNFRIDTSLDFKECGILPVDIL